MSGTLGDMKIVVGGSGVLRVGDVWSFPEFVSSTAPLNQFVVFWSESPIPPEPMIPRIERSPAKPVNNRAARRRRAAEARRNR